MAIGRTKNKHPEVVDDVLNIYDEEILSVDMAIGTLLKVCKTWRKEMP